VRIDAIRIHNFRGLERAELDGLATSPLVTVSGPNGAGKSLLFEAIYLLWRIIPFWQRQQLLASSVVGPWADACEIEVSVVLSDDEQEVLTQYNAAAGQALPAEARATMRFRLTRDGEIELDAAHWSRLLWTVDFTASQPFANVDYFPADRSFPRGEHASVNPALLSDQQREAFRDQITSSFVQQRQMVSLSGIAPLLASLDYVDLLAEREEKPSSGDFDALANAFGATTSKTILRPTLDPAGPTGSVLLVSTPAGVNHSIDQLSSGEQEVLGLMYFVRRLSARGASC
jgi:hypothetical protein